MGFKMAANIQIANLILLLFYVNYVVEGENKFPCGKRYGPISENGEKEEKEMKSGETIATGINNDGSVRRRKRGTGNGKEDSDTQAFRWIIN